MLISSVANSNNNDNKSIADYAFEAVPMYRRVESIPDQLNKGNGATALGMAALALINLPEDCRDVLGAAKQVKSIFTKEPHLAKYDYKNYQHQFSFFRGTAIEKWLHKNVDEGKKWAEWLYNNDKTLANTEFGKKTLNILSTKVEKVLPTEIKNYKGISVLGFSYKGTKLGELTGRAMQRTTKLGIIALGLLELPKIIKAFNKGDNVLDTTGNVAGQTIKSAVNVATVTAGIAYCGAIGSKYGKGFGSLIGMGVGAILGGIISKKIQETI